MQLAQNIKKSKPLKIGLQMIQGTSSTGLETQALLNPLTEQPGSDQKCEDSRDNLRYNLEDLIRSAVALKILLQQPVTIGDIGTGDVGVRRYTFNLKTGLVSSLGGKEGFDRDYKKPAQNFVDGLVAIVLKYLNNCLIYGTSWGRQDNEDQEISIYEKEMVDSLEKLKYPNIITRILSQADEAEISALSLHHILKFKNPNNPNLAAVTPNNTIQLEGGKGSIQSWSVLPEQKIEKSGNWANQQLKEGKTPVAVKNLLKAELAAELEKAEAIQGIKNIAMQGIFAVGLNDQELADVLGIDKGEWNKGQIPVALPRVIMVLQAKIEKCETAAPDVQAKAAPAILALAMLEAFQEKYGNDFNILNMKDDVTLFYADGTPVGEVAKVCGSHGAAVKYFEHIQGEYQDRLQRISVIMSKIKPKSQLKVADMD